MRAALCAIAASATLVLAGCGTASSSSPSETGPFTRGANGVWIFRPAGKPKALVIFFHGQGGPVETTPTDHVAWIHDLVRHGAIVVYPRYELSFLRAVMPHVLAGVKEAVGKADLAGLPVLSLGYSRGGGLAVEYAAEAPRHALPVPNVVMSVFPAPFGDWSRLISLKPIRHSTRILFLVGQGDRVVGSSGVRLLLVRLERVHFPPGNIQAHVVKSRGSFVANHTAPMGTSVAAKQAFWVPAELLLARLERK